MGHCYKTRGGAFRVHSQMHHWSPKVCFSVSEPMAIVCIPQQTPEAFSVCHAALPVSRLGVHKKLGGDTGRTADRSWVKNDVPYTMTMLSTRNQGTEVVRGRCSQLGCFSRLLSCLPAGCSFPRGLLTLPLSSPFTGCTAEQPQLQCLEYLQLPSCFSSRPLPSPCLPPPAASLPPALPPCTPHTLVFMALFLSLLLPHSPLLGSVLSFFALPLLWFPLGAAILAVRFNCAL